ncbi:type II secretion system F family protein [Vibrio kasasachensis]|uniref:type II secretion system F family protein n=1 Tax=Vibrio kasasachensis TaxID=2910248 RepID=UPI003D102EEC
MISHSVVIALLFIVFGILLFIASLKTEKNQKYFEKYLATEGEKKRDKEQKPEKLLDWIDAIVPSAFAVNETAINRKLTSAGAESLKYAHLYLPIKYAVLFIGCGVIGVLSYGSLETILLIGLLSFWVILTLIVPDMILDIRVKAYRAKITRQLPYVIDLLAVCVQTGMTIEASMGYLAEEMQSFDPKLARLLERIKERNQIVGMDKALDEAYDHIPTSEMRSFVMTLKQSLRYGSSIYQTLTTLSSDIRQVTMLVVEERIGKLAAKMSVPLILFIMIPIVILIAVPGVMRMMSNV